MHRASTSAALAALAFLVGCREAPVTPEGSPDESPEVVTQMAPGGQPGPPSHVVVRIPGPPPRVPVPLPPRAGPPSFLRNIVDIGAGADFSCALRSDGITYCWGANGAGQLGDGSMAPSSAPVEVSGPTRFARLFVGNLHVCGLTSGGEAWCWGDNQEGKLGIGSGVPRVLVPTRVAGGHTFLGLSLALLSTCGLASDGVTYCWGSNRNGQLGIGSAAPGPFATPVPVANSAALGFTQVSASFFHSCALDASGGVHCWGNTSWFGNGALGPVVYEPQPAAGGALLSQVDAGVLYSCGVDGNGVAWCWGTANPSGEMGLGSTERSLSPMPVVGGIRFASVDAHNLNSIVASTCGLTPAGVAWCWGSNQFGQLGASGSDTCTAAGMEYSCSTTPLMVSGGRSWRQVVVGIRHTCGVDGAGDAWCWGSNNTGQLGDGTMADTPVPVQVRGLDASPQIGSVVVSPSTVLLELLGSTQAFSAVALDEEGLPLPEQPDFTWSSSDPVAAPVDGQGVVTARADGFFTITATTPGGMTGRGALRVTLVDPAVAFRTAWVGGRLRGQALDGGGGPVRAPVGRVDPRGNLPDPAGGGSSQRLAGQCDTPGIIRWAHVCPDGA